MAAAAQSTGERTAGLASFLSTTTYDALPERAREQAKMAVASTLASAAAGVVQRSATIARDLVVARGGVPEATLWFDPAPRLPATHAARVNAMRSDAAAADDSDFRTIAHTGTTVVAAALAVGEREGADGRAAITAVAAGYEACGRFGEAMSAGLDRRGFHPVVLNGLGGAVTAGHLLGLAPSAMLDAIVLASTAAAGLRVATNGWTREYQAGTAVAAGVDAALAAEAGFRTEPAVLDGFLATLAGTADADALTRGLGDAWDIETDLGIKLRPGGYPFAAAVEAAIEAVTAVDAAPEDVARIAVSGPWFRDGLVGVRHPTDFVEAIHSLAFYVAAGVLRRRFGWDALDPDRLDDPRLARLLDLVEVDVDPPGGFDGYAFRWGATVEVTTSAGAVGRKVVDAPSGSARRGLRWEDVDGKLAALLGRAGHSSDRVQALLAAIHGLDDLDDLRVLASAP